MKLALVKRREVHRNLIRNQPCKEFETGQTRLREVEMQQSHIRETLLRISGAIQVLEELLAETAPGEEREARSLETPQVCSPSY